MVDGRPSSRVLHPGALFAELVKAGVIREDELIRRVVIDIDAGSAPVLYIERYADQRILEVLPVLAGIEIRTGEQEGTVGRHRYEPSLFATRPDDRSGKAGTETRGGDKPDWKHAQPGEPLPELPPDKDALEPETGYEPEDAG